MSAHNRSVWWSTTALLLYLALITVLIHCATNGAYGYFRDELYYLACADHLAWGYVDHPPLSIFVLAITRKILGDSIFAIRLPVALAGAACVAVTGLMARELGGGRFAQWLAALAYLVMPAGLAIGSFFSMNGFDLLFWIGCAFVLIRIIRTGNPRLWLAFGLIAGLGLLNKISVGFLAFGVVLGLLLTPQRRLLLTPWAWLGGALALALFLPHLIWQLTHGFPTLEFIHNATKFKNVAMAPAAYLQAQLLLTNPVTLPVWLTGLGYLLFAKGGRAYRALGIAYLAVLALLIVQHGKAYYLVPAYAMLFAAGGVGIERFTDAASRRWMRPALGALVAVSGVALAPLAIPVLSPEHYVRYAQLTGAQPPREERHAIGELPQIFADRLGWENMVATIARVYGNLPPEDRARCAILASNYGEAGAVDFFGPRFGLPHAISGHNNYWLWGPDGATGEVVIAIGFPERDLQQYFTQVEQAATVVSAYALPTETNLPVYVCHDLKLPMREAWPHVKRFV